MKLLKITFFTLLLSTNFLFSNEEPPSEKLHHSMGYYILKQLQKLDFRLRQKSNF